MIARTIPRLTMVFLSGLLTALLMTFGCSQGKRTSTTALGPTGLSGKVLSAGNPVAGATVTLYAASSGQPAQLAQGATDGAGSFLLDVAPAGIRLSPDQVLYLIARRGAPAAGESAAPAPGPVALMALLGHALPKSVTVNELTTVASAFTAARFFNGSVVSGGDLGLRIASGNVPNLVDLETGGWGSVLLDPLNSTQTTTLANLNTLGSLLAYFETSASDDWRARFLKAATAKGGTTPKDALEAVAGIARTSWANPKALFALFDEAYPKPADGSERSAPFLPYLDYAPKDFALSLCFAGGGMLANGKFAFDVDGNLWSGQNWMPGSQSSVVDNIGGGVIKMAPNGETLSPPVTGFRPMGIDGIGWGTAVSTDRVWTSSFNGSIGVMDLNGRAVGKESDIPVAGQLGQLMGIGVAPNGDVWIADGSKNQMVFFPGGRLQEGRIVHVDGLKSPFGVTIDAENRVLVSNSQSDTVVRFPANDPSKVASFKTGPSARGVALDSKGNIWVASLMAPGFPVPDIPDGTPIMQQFRILGDAMVKTLSASPTASTGVVHMIRPDGSQLAPDGFTGGKSINVPWGLNLDGNDDVWVANFWGRSVVLMAGAEPRGVSAGAKTGDVLHVFQSGSIQMLTDVAIDPAGNIWAANNWNLVQAAMGQDTDTPYSTWGGGSGLTVIYGVAEPVKTPVMGQVHRL